MERREKRLELHSKSLFGFCKTGQEENFGTRFHSTSWSSVRPLPPQLRSDSDTVRLCQSSALAYQVLDKLRVFLIITTGSFALIWSTKQDFVPVSMAY